MSNATAQRLDPRAFSNNYLFQRSLLPYVEAAKKISGSVLEVGTGMGYGIEHIAPRASHFLTVDKYVPAVDFSAFPNVEFRRLVAPPFSGIEDDRFDFVISFQVIEHIKDDKLFLEEIRRVLKKGGRCIITTPNKRMSLTRNPWHIREYHVEELKRLMQPYFSRVEALGIYGNRKVMEYYAANKKSVEKIMRWDVLNLQYRLPRWLLQIPFDLANKINRKKLLDANYDLTASISMDDYYIKEAGEECMDLLYIGYI